MGEKLVVIGAGHGAGQLVASLRQKEYPGEITLVGEEPYFPYQRPPLSKKFLAGELPSERLYFKPPAFYHEAGVDVRLATRVESIDRARRILSISDGKELAYEKLVLATGARVRKLDAPGADLPGIHYLRGIDDVERIRDGLHQGSKLVVVGAGYIGLEVAAVANTLGVDVTVVEMAERVMSRVVAPPVSDFYQQQHRERGIELLLSTPLSGFSGYGAVSAVELADGRTLPADIVLIGIGVEPVCELAADAGLGVGDGIIVDTGCRTGDPDIYAIGDCTRHPNPIYGRDVRLESVHNALEQARTAAGNLCGEHCEYAQVPWFWSDQYDLKLQIAGLSQGFDDLVVRGDPVNRSFSCVYLRERRMIAVDAINAPRDFMQSKAIISAAATIDVARLADANIQLKDCTNED